MAKSFGIALSGFELVKKSEGAALKKKIKKALKMLGLKEKLLSVHLCDDAEIKSMNKKFRKKNKATDVLSFEAAMDAGDPFMEHVLGDIVISVDTAKRQAQTAGHSLLEELTVLFVHGLLHVLGYDHERGDEESVMQAEAELFVLSGLDIPVEIALIGRHLSC